MSIPCKKEEYWTMKDGTEIAVGDMEEEHVRNALRMVIRRHRESDSEYWEVWKQVKQWGEWGDIF